MKLFLVSLAVLCGCASAGPGNSIIGGIDDAGTGDGRGLPELDARVIDASPRSVTLDQTANTEIKSQNARSCEATAKDRTVANSYYRIFAMADHGVTATLHVSEVVFGVEYALAETGGMQPAKLTLGNYTGTPGTTIDPSKITVIQAVNIMVNDTLTGDRVTVPIGVDISPDTQLVVQLDLPANASDYNRFFIGSNDKGERKPGYWGSTSCGLTPPETFASQTDIGHEVDILMTVSGSM